MIGTRRVRSVPRISSASSYPSIPGICTSSRASATSCRSSSSSAAGPDGALRISTPSRRSSASIAIRFFSTSSTTRIFTVSGCGMIDPRSYRQDVAPVYLLFRHEVGERAGMRGEAQILLRAKPQETAAHQALPEQAERTVLQRPIEIDQHVAAGDEMRLGEHLVAREIVLGEHRPGAQALVEHGAAIARRIMVRQRSPAARGAVVLGELRD